MAKHDVSVELFYDSQWNEHGTDVLTGDAEGGQDITITRGKGNEGQAAPPAAAQLTFRGWDFKPDNVLSDLYGKIGRNTPLRITVDDDLRFVGEVAKWTPQQSLGGTTNTPRRWVKVEATGINRRLEQGADPIQSAPRRYLPYANSSLLGYWPLEDRASARAAEVVGSHAGPLRPFTGAGTDLLTRPRFGEGTLAPWLSPCLRLGTDPGLQNAVMTAGVRGDSASWTLDWLFRAASGPSLTAVDVQNALDSETRFRVRILFSPEPAVAGENIFLRWTDVTTQTTLDTVTVDTLTPFDGRMHHFRLEVTDTGSGCDYTLYMDGVQIIDDAVANVNLVPGHLALVGAMSVAQEGGSAYADLGHIAMWTGTPPTVTDVLDAYRGHQGEHAGRRIERLCEEEGVPFVGDNLDDTIPMGPQYPDGFVTLLRECEAVDHGLLIDGADLSSNVPALDYRPHRELYNQLTALQLNYASARLAPPFEPVLDDQATRNDVTARRRDGGTAQAVDDDSVTAVGRYTESVETNVMGDAMLGDQAGWLLHLGTLEGTRYPRVTVDLDASPTLATSVAGVVEGDRILLTVLPDELSPDFVSLIVLGWTEVIGSHRRRITYNCVPELAYHIGEVEHDDYGRIDADPAWQFVTTGTFTSGTSTTLGVAFEAGAAGAGGFNWAGADVPFDIRVAGVVLRVTAVSGTTSPHIFTVQQTPINGVTKAIPAGSVVELASPAYIGL